LKSVHADIQLITGWTAIFFAYAYNDDYTRRARWHTGYYKDCSPCSITQYAKL